MRQRTYGFLHRLIPLLLLVSAALLSSCGNTLMPVPESPAAKGGGAAYIVVSVGQISRTLSPGITVSQFTDVVLEGTLSGNTRTLAECGTIAELESKAIQVDAGSWTLSLSAKLNGREYAATQTLAVSAGTNAATFTLSPATPSEPGSFSIGISFPPQTVQSVQALLTLSDFSTVIAQETFSAGTDYSTSASSATVTFGGTDIAGGDYVLRVFFNARQEFVQGGAETEQDMEPLSVWGELVRIRPGASTAGTITVPTVTEIYSVSYENMDDGEGGTYWLSTDSNLFPLSYTRFTNGHESDPYIVTLPAQGSLVTRDGCWFAGWYETADFSGSPVTQFDSRDTEDKTFYARWHDFSLYIAEDGDDDNDGLTLSTALASIAGAGARMNEIAAATGRTSEDWTGYISGTLYGDNYIWIDGGATLSASSLTFEGYHGDGTDGFDGEGEKRMLLLSWANPFAFKSLSFKNGYGDGGDCGGAILKQGSGTLLLEDCTFTGNKATSGGAVAVIEAGQATVRNCTFIRNTAVETGDTWTGLGGAICNMTSGLLISGCTFGGTDDTDANTAKWGGAVAAVGNETAGATTTITGSSIRHNRATVYGGGVFQDNTNSVMSIQSTSIMANRAAPESGTSDGKGAGLYNMSGKMNFGSSTGADGVTISGNISTAHGGGISNKGTVNFYSGTVSGNISQNEGGAGILNGENGIFYLRGGSVTGNSSASTYGGGVYNYKGTFHLVGGAIGGTSSGSGNTAGTMGGGIYSMQGTVYVSGGTLGGNSAITQGGGLYATASTVEVSAGSIEGNVAGTDGGGIYIDSSSTVTLTGGAVSSNLAAGKGKAIYAGGTLKMQGDAYVAGDNDVYLPTGKTVTLSGTLTEGTSTVATLTPATYSTSTQVLSPPSGWGNVVSVALSNATQRFAITKNADDTDGDWGISNGSPNPLTWGRLERQTHTVYVSSTGTSGGSGSKTDPVDTVANAIGKLSVKSAGDNIIYLLDDITITNGMGVSDAALCVTVRGCAGGTIGSAVTIYCDTPGYSGLYTQNGQQYTFRNITFSQHSGITNDYAVINTTEETSVSLEDCTFTGITANGVAAIHADGSVSLENVTISENTVIPPSGSSEWGAAINVGKGTVSISGKIIVTDNIGKFTRTIDNGSGGTTTESYDGSANVWIGTSDGTASGTYCNPLEVTGALTGSSMGVRLYNDYDITGPTAFTSGYSDYNSADPATYFSSDGSCIVGLSGTEAALAPSCMLSFAADYDWDALTADEEGVVSVTFSAQDGFGSTGSFASYTYEYWISDADGEYITSHEEDGTDNTSAACTVELPLGKGCKLGILATVTRTDGSTASCWTEKTYTATSSHLYVAADGSDGWKGKGSKEAPFKTVTKAISVLNARNDSSASYTVHVSGFVTDNIIIAEAGLGQPLAARALTIAGTDADTDGIDGNESGAVLEASLGFDITLSRLTIRNGSGTSGGGISVDGGGILTLQECVIQGNTSSHSGGGIYVGSGTNLALGYTTVDGNEAAENGGALYFNGSNASITGTNSFSSNKAANGGGIYVAGGTFKILTGDTAVSDNEATTNGGGIAVGDNGTLLLSGGTISGNTASMLGGGVYNNGTLYMYGTAVIGDASADSAATGTDYSNSALSGGGVYNAGTAYLGYSDASTKRALTGGVYYNYASGAYGGGGICTESDFVAASGTIAYNCAYNGGGIGRKTGAFDTTGLVIRKNVATAAGGGICLFADGTDCTISGCTISDNAAETNGGGIYSRVNLTVASGTISKNSAIRNGGGIYTRDKTCTISGGIITGNKTEENDGGGISNEGILIITAGTISKNSARSGGGVVNSGTFTCSGGTITDNTAAGNGGGVENGAAGTFTLDGGLIQSNTATLYGGGVWTSGSTVILSGTITKNRTNATAYGGGGIYVISGNLTMDGGTISDNVADVDGAGIYIYTSAESRSNNESATATIRNGTITGNTASRNGGGIAIGACSTLTLTGGTVTGNSAAGNGTGVYIETNKNDSTQDYAVFKMEGDALIASDNDVYLSAGKNIDITGALTSTETVATITPEKYEIGTKVLGGTAVGTEHSKFAVSESGWEIASDGTLQKQLSSGMTITMPSTSADNLSLSCAANAGGFTFTASSLDPDAAYVSWQWIVTDGIGGTTTESTWTVTRASFAAGQNYTLVVIATDGDGNTASARMGFTVD